MAITTLDGAIAGMQYARNFAKAVTGTMVAGRLISTWGLAGNPGAGSYNGTLNGTTVNSSDAGSLNFTNPVSGNTYLARFLGQATISGQLILCDRLWHNGGITITSTSSQAISSPTFPARDALGATNGDGVLLGIEVSATTGAGTPTITMGYTNSQGTTLRTATNIEPTVASTVLRTFHRIGLQAGDVGVRAVSSIQLSATWTSGTINVVAYRPICSIALSNANTPSMLDSLTSGFPQIFNDSSLFFLFVPSTTTTSNISGEVVWSQG